MALDRVRNLLVADPRTLRELEAALGFSLARDASGEEAWLVRRKKPIAGIDSVYAGFAGVALHDDPDPRLDELRLQVSGIDTRDLADQVLGPGQVRGGEVSYDYHHSSAPVTAPTSHAWPRANGTFEVHSDARWLFWKRNEAPFASVRTPEEEAWLVRRVGALLAGPLDDARIVHAFGPPVMTGRIPERFVRDTTWRLAVHPVEAPTPERAILELEPGMPLDRLLQGLGWPPSLVATSGVHQSLAHVVDARTLRAPVLHGSRVQIVVAGTNGLTPSAAVVPAQRVYETHGAIAKGIDIRPHAG